MKFVYFGYDFMLPSITRLISDGHTLMGIFSFECDNVFNFNIKAQTLAAELNVPFLTHKATAAQIDAFIEDGCECFISGGYPYKIPPIEEDIALALNIHPTYLPEGRGLMPIPRIIMDHIDSAAGFTAHKMTQVFDGGDILLQHKFELSKTETVESYCAKIAVHAPEFTVKLMSSLPEYWEKAKPQGQTRATHFSPPTDEDRFLDWNKPAKALHATYRAFGRYGSLACFDDTLWVVYECDIWEERHQLPPGTVAARMSREIVIATCDGFIVIKGWEKVKNVV